MSLIRKHGAVLQAWACLDLVLVCVCISVLLWCFILIYNQCGCTFVASE